MNCRNKAQVVQKEGLGEGIITDRNLHLKDDQIN